MALHHRHTKTHTLFISSFVFISIVCLFERKFLNGHKINLWFEFICAVGIFFELQFDLMRYGFVTTVLPYLKQFTIVCAGDCDGMLVKLICATNFFILLLFSTACNRFDAYILLFWYGRTMRQWRWIFLKWKKYFLLYLRMDSKIWLLIENRSEHFKIESTESKHYKIAIKCSVRCYKCYTKDEWKVFG